MTDKPPPLKLPDGSAMSGDELSTLAGFLHHPGWPVAVKYFGACIVEESGLLADWNTTQEQTQFLRGRIDALRSVREWFERVVPAAYIRMLETLEKEKPKEPS